MKRFFLFFAAFAAQVNIAQNTFPFPENGNVGIGTVAPISKLTINGSLALN
ncbi:hypothetical protein [Flavobacterium ginsengiterrae]|uniref:Uncharacterized protein n=1 Tax=Flavobacterium ginsengiterrae TaxID=871695 RepID=A0ABP7GTV1_9FLAO